MTTVTMCDPCRSELATWLATVGLDLRTGVESVPSSHRLECKQDGTRLIVVGEPLADPSAGVPTDELGRTLRRFRARMGQSQGTFAVMFGVTQKAVSTWEQGTRRMPTTAIYALLEHYGINAEEFLRG